MIVTLTEMGVRRYVVDMDGERVVYTREIGKMIRDRGRRLWRENGFGRGRLGRQAQYEVEDGVRGDGEQVAGAAG